MNCEISLFLKQMDWSGRVLNIISNDTENFLWNKMYDVYKFKPGTDHQCEWIQIPCESKVYYKDTPWTAEQESIINSCFEELTDDEMYALDWKHDCFTFSPKEHIPFEYEEYDSDRKCQVYFPTYYPNGDYHVFVDKEWKYGLFGHPWKHEIVVMGEKLIEMFEKEKVSLGI